MYTFVIFNLAFEETLDMIITHIYTRTHIDMLSTDEGDEVYG